MAKGRSSSSLVNLPIWKLALNEQVPALLDILQQGLGLLVLIEAGDGDGAGAVCNVKIDDPGVALGELLVMDGEHLAVDDHAPHIDVQLADIHRLPVNGFA